MEVYDQERNKQHSELSTSWISSSSTVSFSLDDNVVMHGFLKKRGGWNPAWKSRYFVLDGRGRLHYFKVKSDSSDPARCMGSIPITSETYISTNRESKGVPGLTFEVRIAANDDHSGRTFYFKTETSEEADVWVTKLKAVAEQILFVSFDCSSRHW
mmetsp:Transcript_87626/g.233306  ORF Transcript_87626/g.233306 Transcript_87626/m.233306 type:complete len:156 (+) Transcript_87626:55-522(+)